MTCWMVLLRIFNCDGQVCWVRRGSRCSCWAIKKWANRRSRRKEGHEALWLLLPGPIWI